MTVLLSLVVASTPIISYGEIQAFEQLSLFNQEIEKDDITKSKSPDYKNGKEIKTIAQTQKNIEQAPQNGSKSAASVPSANDFTDTLKQAVIDGKKPMSDEEAINAAAFDQVRQKLYPLKHDQVMALHRDQEEQEFTLAASAHTPPRPAVTTQVVRLDPGSTPSVIRLGQGFISSVVFLDSTGAPWPIIAYDQGDPTAYGVQWDKSGNTLMIQAKKMYTYGNMAVRLQGLSTPVMLTIIPGQQVIDYRVDMRVVGYGPNAKNAPTGLNLPEATSDVLMQVLDDIPPPGATQMTVKGGPAKVWQVGSLMYVRTQLTILSPGWLSMMTSADGTHVYKMSNSPILLVSWHGKVMQLKIEG